ncbi:LysR family transcriptional regulator [Jannaschia sp. CCS1]|uniref:LysR family transcriptional regulator n=1 Tax=Jannaschia sp. (strain CCS1) TaxID=290400 RepID=UPI000053D856|nr:LysR family transcriptional regulator [Jannaschia sp. CCS1]ABD55438.1 transcriptional regulator, LysR family [Jannaschia sp. CCS1]
MWDDLALFSAVARHGSLTAAATQTDSSAATLSRRMKALEAAMDRPLFLHGRDGYALTAEGRELLQRTERMEAAAADIESWRNQGPGKRRVRISAGSWTSDLLARHLADFWQPDFNWVPEFLHCERDMDIARRQIDIGVRNHKPDQPWLAGRRTGEVNFAPFARDTSVTEWIGAAGDRATLPSARWVDENQSDHIVTRANDAHLAMAMACAGIGRVVLPTFVGASARTLVQVGEPIEALRSEQWLVCHHEGRHDPPVRHALTALAQFLTSS